MNTPARPEARDLELARRVASLFAAHAEVVDEARRSLPEVVARAARLVIDAYRAGGKVLVFGNGGSFSDALHIEGELTNRFRRDHDGLPAVCLGAGGATLTATANDYSYAELFARLVRAYGRDGDIALGLTTSGNSENVVRGLAAGRALGLRTIAMTGRGGGKAREYGDVWIAAPSDDTPRIQEIHILAAHSICELAEDALFPPAA